jgi:HAE1 family hydrophobic/amphiphilic exporter-1
MKLTRIAVDNPVFATMMMVALLVMGLFSYRQLGVDQFPNVDFPIVVVTTNYPGAAPETVESEISRKIEESVNAIAGLKNLSSRSLEGQSIVIAEFELSVPSAAALQDVREKVQMVRAAFRPEIKEPLIQRFNPDDQPIVSVAVRSKVRAVRELTTIADQIVVKRLQTVRDVGPRDDRRRREAPGATSSSIRAACRPSGRRQRRHGGGARREPELSRRHRQARQRRPCVEVTGGLAEPGHFADLIVAAAAMRRSICARSPPWSTGSRNSRAWRC